MRTNFCDDLLKGAASGARYFLRNGAEVFETGERFTQPQLARVLDVVARDGITPFYQGEIAEQIDRDMRNHDGFLRMEDLALIPSPVERRVLQRSYRGYLVKSMPPPGAGRTLLLVLMTLGNLKSRFLAGRTPVRHHFLAEALRKAFLTRLDRPFDANTYHQIPDKVMLSRAYARELALSIADDIDDTLPLTDPPSTEETTHFSVMDAEGNAVSMTQSIELVYGAKVAADGLGFLYNNYMSALKTKIQAIPTTCGPTPCPGLPPHRPSSSARVNRGWLREAPAASASSRRSGSSSATSSTHRQMLQIVDHNEAVIPPNRLFNPPSHLAMVGHLSCPSRGAEGQQRLGAPGEPRVHHLDLLRRVPQRLPGAGRGVACSAQL